MRGGDGSRGRILSPPHTPRVPGGKAPAVALVVYLPGHELECVLLEGLDLVQPRHDDLLQLLEAVRLERHPGQTLETFRKKKDKEIHTLGGFVQLILYVPSLALGAACCFRLHSSWISLQGLQGVTQFAECCQLHKRSWGSK